MNTEQRIKGAIDSDRLGYPYFECCTAEHKAKAKVLIEKECGVAHAVIQSVTKTQGGFYGDGFPVLTFHYTATPLSAWQPLNAGQVIMDGDLFQMPDGAWVETTHAGRTVHPLHGGRYRRAVVTPAIF